MTPSRSDILANARRARASACALLVIKCFPRMLRPYQMLSEPKLEVQALSMSILDRSD